MKRRGRQTPRTLARGSGERAQHQILLSLLALPFPSLAGGLHRMKETPESAAAKTQALSHLQVLFPDADPGYLSSVLQYHLSWRPIPASSSDNKGKAKDSTAGAAELVQRVSQKMLELNHCEYPRTAWVPAQQRRAAGEKNGKVGGKLKDLKQVRQAWGNARGGSGEEERVAGGSRGPMEGPMVVDETLARNQAL